MKLFEFTKPIKKKGHNKKATLRTTAIGNEGPGYVFGFEEQGCKSDYAAYHTPKPRSSVEDGLNQKSNHSFL